MTPLNLQRIRSGQASLEEAGLTISLYLKRGRPVHLSLYGALSQQTVRIVRDEVPFGEAWEWRRIMRGVYDHLRRWGSDYVGQVAALHDLIDMTIREREQLDRSGRLDQPEVPPAAAGHEARSGE